MNVFSRIYVKYIIKSQFIFYTFLTAGIVIFLAITLSIKVEMVRKYEAYFDNNKIVLNDDIADIDSLYVYKSLNEKMFSFDINSIERVENHAIIYVKNEDETIKNRLLGIVRLEIVENSQSLFELIFLRAGVKINE